MPATIATRPVHPELPVDEAWQQGRRLYVRCSASSRLSGALRGRGAQWDPYAKALWLSTRHREDFTAWALEHRRVRERLREIRQAGLWVDIPYPAGLIRARAKELGAIFDGAMKRWAVPTPADLVEIEDLIEVWNAAQARERALAEQRWAEEREIRRRTADLEAAERRRAARERDAAHQERELEAAALREAERRAASRRADTFRAELARTVGRTLLGPLEARREVFPRFTSGDTARAQAPHVGAVVRLDDGRRALVWARTVRYVPLNQAHGYGMDRAHWYAEYLLALVAPSEDELDAEEARGRARMDAEELHDLVQDAALLTCPREVDRPARISGRVGAVTVTTGINGLVPAGRLVLDADGTVWWQHPGTYDTYVPVQGVSRDADLVARVRAVLATGPRRRTRPCPGGPPLHYEVA